jgi:hypothetical protein|tara:strand:- start:984 stop:1238 length:255 start_codon:yes stop_codon:yes gene_type:complete
MGKLIERALSACGVAEVPVRAMGDLAASGRVWHCGLIVEYNDGRFEGRIYNNDTTARSFMRKRSDLYKNCMMLDKIPTEWYKMI